MCAIYSLSIEIDHEEILKQLRFSYGDEVADKYQSIDLYPKSEAPVLGANGKVELMKWGFPLASKNQVIFNARIETLQERSLFKGCYKNHCLIPASSFYEWGEASEKKQKYNIKPDTTPFYFAALYKSYIGKGGTQEYYFTIITTEPSTQMSLIHSRMPAIITEDGISDWLDAKIPATVLLKPYSGNITIKEVQVGSV